MTTFLNDLLHFQFLKNSLSHLMQPPTSWIKSLDIPWKEQEPRQACLGAHELYNSIDDAILSACPTGLTMTLMSRTSCLSQSFTLLYLWALCSHAELHGRVVSPLPARPEPYFPESSAPSESPPAFWADRRVPECEWWPPWRLCPDKDGIYVTFYSDIKMGKNTLGDTITSDSWSLNPNN